ncbi:MAG: O-antigen ligase family protein [Patescibacteria group bacterium]|nr:O-antigen ligase family protein [Patescibacteria group bacterium]
MYSIWYFIRWPLFLYLAYILVPFNLIRDRKTLKYVLITITFSSLIVLVFGFLSLYGQDITNSVFRIRSIPFFGVYPFGQNHNLIAEFLNIGTFFILSLRALAKSVRFKRFLDVVFILSAIGIILTFSRTAWIVLALQSLVYIWLYFKDRRVNKKQIVVPIIILVLMFIPFIFKMENIQEENTSSTDNRLMLTQISLEAFKEKPLIGHGSGEYIRQVEKNIRFRAKYGEPIDSHGILQKVLTENGILGFVSWIFIVLVLSLSFYSALLKYRKKAPWLPPLIIGSMGGLIFQFLNTSYYKGKVWLPIVITLLAIQLLETDSKRKERGEER